MFCSGLLYPWNGGRNDWAKDQSKVQKGFPEGYEINTGKLKEGAHTSRRNDTKNWGKINKKDLLDLEKNKNKKPQATQPNLNFK